MLGRAGDPPVLSRSSVPAQLLWYLPVGGGAFVVDLVVLVALIRAGAPVLAAATVGFVIGTLTNYALSRLMAFTAGRHRPAGEITRLFAVSLVALGLTLALVALFHNLLGLPPVVARTAAAALVLAWSFLARRLLVFRPELPARSYRLTVAALDAALGGRRRPSAPPEGPLDAESAGR